MFMPPLNLAKSIIIVITQHVKLLDTNQLEINKIQKNYSNI